MKMANPHLPKQIFSIKMQENSSGKSSKVLMNRLIRELPRPMVEGALGKYADDYEMFGFDMKSELDEIYDSSF